MKSTKKLINRILTISSGFLILVIGFSFYLISFKAPKRKGCATVTPQFICGTASLNLTENARKGKQLFNANCAACHHLDKKMTGPALAKTDSILMWSWLTAKNNNVDSTKFNEMGIDYHKNLWAKTLNPTELNDLYKYLNLY